MGGSLDTLHLPCQCLISSAMTGPSGCYSCSVWLQYTLRRANAAPYHRRVCKRRYTWRFQRTVLYPFSSCFSQKSHNHCFSASLHSRAWMSSCVPPSPPTRLDFARLHTVQEATQDVTCAQRFLTPPPYSGIYETITLTATHLRLAMNRCCHICASAHNKFIREPPASALPIIDCGVTGAVPALCVSNVVDPCSAEALSIPRIPENASYAAGASYPLTATLTASSAARVDLSSAALRCAVPGFRIPTAENRMSFAAFPLQGTQTHPLLECPDLFSVAGHQRRRASTLRQVIRFPSDISQGEQLHGEQSRWHHEDQHREDLQHRELQLCRKHDRRQQPHQPAQQVGCAERQQRQFEPHGPRLKKQGGLQNTLSAPATGQQKRCRGPQQGQQHQSPRQSRGVLTGTRGWQPNTYELRWGQNKHQTLWRRYWTKRQVNTACSGEPRQAGCSTQFFSSHERAFDSRLLADDNSSNHLLPAGRFRYFSTSSELLARELQRRLAEEDKTGRTTTAAVYDRERQGIVLAIADDVLLVRGLAAAPVGTLVAFSHNAVESNRMAAATVAGDARQAAAAATEGGTPKGNVWAADKTTGPGVAGANNRKVDTEDKPALVLGVVLQLLQQDLNIVGLLGATNSVCSSAGEHVPFLSPCVGDLCTGISAYAQHQPSYLQQHPPEHQQKTLPHNDGGKDLCMPQRDGEQAKKRYKLIDACLPAGGCRAIASPLTLLHRSTPISAASHQASQASEDSIAFFNALDISQSSQAPPPRPQTNVRLPWGLLTGSAVVDALAPLQVGEASAFLGPPGTGKTEALVPVIALHAAAAAGVAGAGSAAEGASAGSAGSALMSTRFPATSNADAPSGMPLQKRTPLSVVALAFGGSPSRLRRGLDAVSKAVAVLSPAEWWTGATAAKTASKSPLSTRFGAPPDGGTTASGTAAASLKPAHCAADTPLHSLESVVLLHVPAPQTAASEAVAAKPPEQTDFRGYRVHPTSCLTYLAPVLALRLALEAQATAAAEGTACPVLLVIDGLAMHAAAVEQLQLNIRRLLCSYSASVHLPAGAAGLTPPARTAQLPPGAASAYGAAAAAAVALPYSVTSLYGMLASKTSLSAGEAGPLSALLVLDTPSDPAVLTARNLQRSTNGLPVQQQKLEETLVQTVKGEDSVGVVLSRKLARQAEEALLSSVHRTILFALGTQQQGQHQGVARAARRAVQQKQHQRQPCGKAGVEPGWRKKISLVDRVYPMIDIDSMVATSTAILSADACTALSQSCFAGRDGPTAEAEGVSLEALRDALKALCRRQLRAERQLLHSLPPSMPTSGAYTLGSPFQEGLQGSMKARTRRQPVLEPPALLAAAAAAFAWQRRVLHDESERQELMQQFRLFVDVWEQEDVDSLSIASAVCLTRPAGRVFNPSEQLVLLRAAATLFFTPARARESSGERKEGRHATEACGAPSTSGDPAVLAAGPRETGLLSFERICAFQEDLLQLFREKEPRLWNAVQQHLQRAGKWPMELHFEVLERPHTQGVQEPEIADGSNTIQKLGDTICVQTSAEEEEQVEHMAQDVMYLINRVDAALLAMRNYFDITAPSFPEE